MEIRTTVKRRIVWAVAIGVTLIAIVVVILTYADSYAISEGAQRCAPSFLKSKWPLYFGCAMAAREGLAGGLLGGAGALWAAWLAFQAVQEQLSEEREREQRRQAEAKPVAVVCLTPSVHSAAAALAAIDMAVVATPERENEKDGLVRLMATHTKSTIESDFVRAGLRDLGVQDRLYYLAIIATMSGFIDVCLRPSPALTRTKGLESQRATLMSLHRHLRRFDAKLADVFSRESKTSPSR